MAVLCQKCIKSNSFSLFTAVFKKIVSETICLESLQLFLITSAKYMSCKMTKSPFILVNILALC